jgi:hypothetical protein
VNNGYKDTKKKRTAKEKQLDYGVLTQKIPEIRTEIRDFFIG